MKDERLHAALLQAVDDGHVSRRTKGPLAIYNYTKACQYGRHWTDVTMAARGLILEESTSEVAARPFRKFFNVDERPETAADVLPWDEPHEVAEKMDGSLGIIYRYGGKWDIATRGAFDSPQAVYARENLLPQCDPDGPFRRSGITILVEIVYPGARREHVVDYGERDELVFLATIGDPGYKVHEQRRRAVEAGFSLPRLATPQCATGAPDKHAPNTEGYVIYWPARDLRVKVKSDEYTAAHRMLSQVTPRRVLEEVEQGTDDDIAGRLPEHIRETFDEVRGDLGEKLLAYLMAGSIAWNEHKGLLRKGRKDFALGIRHLHPTTQALCFAHASDKGEEAVRRIAFKAVAKTMKTEQPTEGES